MQSRKPKLDAK